MKKIILGLLFLSTSLTASEHLGEWVTYKKTDSQGGIFYITYSLTSYDDETSTYTLTTQTELESGNKTIKTSKVPSSSIWSKEYTKTIFKSCSAIGGKFIKKDYGKGKEKFCRLSVPGRNNQTDFHSYGLIPILGYAELEGAGTHTYVLDYDWN